MSDGSEEVMTVNVLGEIVGFLSRLAVLAFLLGMLVGIYLMS